MPQRSPFSRYETLLTEGRLKPDMAQREAIESLQALYRKLQRQRTMPRLSSLTRRRDAEFAHQGMYLWGGVGRGKSMLMDMFVESIQLTHRSRRQHFHAFMRDIHARLHAYRQIHSDGDILPRIVKELSREMEVLCLDELEVRDVADAMILARLFTGLLDAGITVLFTSNRAPQDLYPGGLQREQFIQFVEAVILPRLHVFELENGTDYRMQQWQSLHQRYVHPRNAASDNFLMECWQELTMGAASQPITLEVHGRRIALEKHVDGVVWMTFPELCMRPLGTHDYLELARVTRVLLLQGIPVLSPEDRNEARRFVQLIDTLYDQRIKLFCTAETPPEGIYAAGNGSEEFGRTLSRLYEMQSDAYLALPKIAVV